MIQGEFSITQMMKYSKWDQLKEHKSKYYIESEERFAGFYENDQKIGFWIEILYYQVENAVTTCGHYVEGLKNGKWSICYGPKIIAGGQYLDGKKTGPWIDIQILKKNEHINLNLCQGLYKNGFKKGNWRIYHNSQQLYRDAGGFYNENGQKDGLWIELQEYTFVFGKYKNGQPFGEWKYQNGELQGLYEENGSKYGCDEWDDNKGHYLDGKKTGYWATNSGEGYFENGLKTGVWTERSKQIWCTGQYKKGKRIGEWKLEYENQKGKGSYDNNGLKQGLWTEFQQKGQIFTFSTKKKSFLPACQYSLFLKMIKTTSSEQLLITALS